MSDWAIETTTDPDVADRRNFYKVELWTRDGLHVRELLHAGNGIDRARAAFEAAIKKRPRGHYTIRQRSLVMAKWPAD